MELQIEINFAQIFLVGPGPWWRKKTAIFFQKQLFFSVIKRKIHQERQIHCIHSSYLQISFEVLRPAAGHSALLSASHMPQVSQQRCYWPSRQETLCCQAVIHTAGQLAVPCAPGSSRHISTVKDVPRHYILSPRISLPVVGLSEVCNF